VLKSFKTTVGSAGSESGLAHVAAFKEADGTSRWVYGGDLLGNLWKFDLQATGSTDINAELLATLKDSAGTAQPVTSTPELVYLSGKRVVLVGTGRILDVGDFGSASTQSFYAIADGTTAVTARSSLVEQIYNASNDTLTSSRPGTPFNWANDRGWYVDLPAGQQANTDPVVVYGAVAFVTNKNGASDCSQSSRLYLLDIGSGLRVPTSTFVSDQIAANATSSRVIALRVVDGRIIGTTHRSDNGVYQRQLPLGTTITPSKNSWREIRR
jgi:type IV pilus assembly protein PilY1